MRFLDPTTEERAKASDATPAELAVLAVELEKLGKACYQLRAQILRRMHKDMDVPDGFTVNVDGEPWRFASPFNEKGEAWKPACVTERIMELIPKKERV